MELSLPPLREFCPASITWSTSPFGYYRLERRFDRDFSGSAITARWMDRDALLLSWEAHHERKLSWSGIDSLPAAELLYEGEENACQDFIPQGVKLVSYRLRSQEEEVLCENVPVLPKPAPVFSQPGYDLGKHYRGFLVHCRVVDDYPLTVLSLTADLDGKIFLRKENLQSPMDETVTIDDAVVQGMEDGSRHVLNLTVADHLLQESTVSYPFTAAAGQLEGSVFYLLRDDVPIAKKYDISPFTDYTTAGRHRYRIRAVDPQGGYSDSNEVVVESRVDGAVLAPLSDPEQMQRLHFRLDREPGIENTFRIGLKSYRFEGRRFEAVEDSGSREREWELAFSLADGDSYASLIDLADRGEPVCYRDQKGNHAVAAISEASGRYGEMGVDFALKLTELYGQEEIDYD